MESLHGIHLNDYLPILIFMSLAAVVVLALTLPPILFAPKNPDKEKLSQYECGFEPFDDARTKFDVRFYLVAILFIIFDLEVAFLFPWAVVFKDMGMVALVEMGIFLSILIVGLE